MAACTALAFKEVESLDTSFQGEMTAVKRQNNILEEDVITKRQNALQVEEEGVWRKHGAGGLQP